MSKFTIITANLQKSKAPVYMQYAGQCQPQPAYILLDADGTVSAKYSGNIGSGIPADQWNGLDKTVRIPANASAHGLQQLFADKDFIAAVTRYYDGRATEWDGNNWTSVLTEDASEALEEIEEMADEVEQANILDVGDWLGYHSRTELEKELVMLGSVQAFFEAQEDFADHDQYLNFDVDELAEFLACHFEDEPDYIEAIKIIVAHDEEYQFLLDDLED